MDPQSVYNYDIERIRKTEFPNLKGVTYVDHVGTTLYSRSQLEAYHKDLLNNVYGNPHTRSQSSRLTTDTIDQVRYRVLQFFNASPEEYSVIFTSGCTGALKLIAETFTFYDTKTENSNQSNTDGSTTDSRNVGQDGGCLVYLLDNHTSVQGMRELVSDRTSGIYCIDEDELHCELPSHLNQIHESKINKVRTQKEHASDSQSVSQEVSGQEENCNLFAYPAQSNFSGRKYPLSWINKVQNREMGFQDKLTGKWYVVLDAACFVSTSKLDLQKYKPDFVTLSFYKIFGFPTGLGALIVKNTTGPLLHKRYFGGGTVSVSNARERFHVFRPDLADRFEDGTISFLDIIAVRHGMESLSRIAGNMDRVSHHTFAVAKFFHDHLVSLRHGNGTPVAHVYCHGFDDVDNQGAIVNFNIVRDDGQFVGFAEVDKLAQLQDIHLRTGCFCNIGACQKHLCLTSQQIRENFDAGHVCGDDRDMIDGRPTGSIRISFGYMSTLEDAKQCLKFVAECFLEGVSPFPEFLIPVQTASSQSEVSKPPLQPTISRSHGSDQSMRTQPLSEYTKIGEEESSLKKLEEEVLGKCSEESRFLSKICLYPVKSCAAFEVMEWDVGPRGLLYDREWMIVSESGVTLGQKREPKLCLLHPKIDLVANTLTLHFPDMPEFQLPLTIQSLESTETEGRLCTNKVCGDRVNTLDCGDDVSDWLCKVLGRPGTRLLRQKQEDRRTGKLKDTTSQVPSDSAKLSLANESQFLLISWESVRSLHKKMSDREDASSQKEEEHQNNVDIDNLVYRFRGNLVVGGGSGFEEEEWSQVTIGKNTLISQGQCSRCQMVCMDQQTGERSKEPLRTLVAWRGKKVPFGVYMRQLVPSTDSDNYATLRVGDKVLPVTTKGN